jgi:hypothetical protein
VAGSAGLPEAEYDEDLKVVSAMRILTDEDYADPSKREAAEREAQAAAEAIMAARPRLQRHATAHVAEDRGLVWGPLPRPLLRVLGSRQVCRALSV